MNHPKTRPAIDYVLAEEWRRRLQKEWQKPVSMARAVEIALIIANAGDVPSDDAIDWAERQTFV